ncbi:ATP-binding protein [Desulfosporosinus burensis]
MKYDFRGARGSNAGDDFHELWALRQALALLDQDTKLSAVTVEGVRVEDENGLPLDTWDGVDCTFYYSGDQIASAERIVIDQLKYSSANPEQTWTLARLTHSTNKKHDNSVIGRLAKAFIGVKTKRPDLIENRNLMIRLVSNQQVDSAVLESLEKQNANSKAVHDALREASGLDTKDFDSFIKSINFSECGGESRFAIEERVLTTISDWTDDDARVIVNELLRFIRRAMMPESKGEVLTRQSILVCLGFSDSRALFPCPTIMKRVDQLIVRDASRKITEQILSGNQRICLHGEGGCGKTTTLQEIEKLLPSDSVVIIFDCYGDGRYLDSDAYRHRSPEAFLQISNDLSRQLQLPLLMNKSQNLDYPKAFKKRLERASQVVASTNPDALLVIAIDAADNSVTAAGMQSPPERSFMHEFMSLGDLPENVRFIITARTGRLPSLNLHRSFSEMEISVFTWDETAINVRAIWNDVPDSWIEDFHYLSRGNPRVQRYSLDYTGGNTSLALQYLRPNGKGLDQVFQSQLEYALQKAGNENDIKVFCSGIIALPRPVPITDLSRISGMSESHICDLCADLAPGIRLINGTIGFADEDFEQFIRDEAKDQLSSVRERIAIHFMSRHKQDAYAATHLAEALFIAGRGKEIIELISTESEPKAITDPILRRETHLQRLRIAMKVCRESGDTIDAIMTVLIGAEALKTNTVIHRLLIDNPDLSANFARETANRSILCNPIRIENHGPLLFQLMAVDARQGNSILVREGHRQLSAWLQRRSKHYEDHRKNNPGIRPQGWSIEDYDIAAEIEAILRVSGPQKALDMLLRWNPKSIAIRVASIISHRLISSGEIDLIKRCITEVKIHRPWNLFLLTPLALAGEVVDLSELEAGLKSLLRRRLIRIEGLRNNTKSDNSDVEFLEIILTAVEIIIARGGEIQNVVPVLERIADKSVRQRDQIYTSQVSIIDLSLRAHALLERLSGHETTLQTYLIDPPLVSGELENGKNNQKRIDTNKNEELQSFIGPLIEIYDVRAQALIGVVPINEIAPKLHNAINQYHHQEYRINREYYASEMRLKVALSITRLMVIQNYDRNFLLECANSIIKSNSSPFHPAKVKVLERFALDQSLHNKILSSITALAEGVKLTRTSAEEKIEAYVRFTRLLLPISESDAESFFNEAIEVAGEVNEDTIFEISLFKPISQNAVKSMSLDERRLLACDLATITSDAGVRLDGNDHFPWDESAEALAIIDVSLALATAAKWDDMNIIDKDRILPSIIQTALEIQEVSPIQVASLSFLFDQLDEELISRIVDEAERVNGNVDLQKLADHLSKEELLRFGKGCREKVCEKLSLLLKGKKTSFWLEQLKQATAFNTAYFNSTSKENFSFSRSSSSVGDEALFYGIDLSLYDFVDPDEITNIINQIHSTAKKSDGFVSVSNILIQISKKVKLNKRVKHLEALTRLKSQNVSDYEVIETLKTRIDEWNESPSVKRWCHERLLQVIIDFLPGMFGWYDSRRSQLLYFIEKSDANDHDICAVLLDAIERHVDTLSASSVYALVGIVGQYCTPSEATQVIKRYSKRLVQRIPIQDQEIWDLKDIPIKVEESLARFLYAMMGDIDVRTRWRAAHALRNLVSMGESVILGKIIELYDRTSEVSYRDHNAPFYWIAARLWLMVSFDRICSETPAVVNPYGLRLFEIACDEKFPHIIIRSFAKAAVNKLKKSREFVLDKTQVDLLEQANISPIRRKKYKESYGHSLRNRSKSGKKDRRFHFDSMDTLPYWYSRAISTFADVNNEEFLDVAEKWIVDYWGVQGDKEGWIEEPRKDRFSGRSYSLMDHRHGSRPVLERFSTHLEWHAMWCAIGELMQTRALANYKDDEYDSFESRLRHECLSAPPLWLADFRSPKPLESQLWFTPEKNLDLWVDDVGIGEFLNELGLTKPMDKIVVDSHHDTRSCDFYSSARVNTALVSPETASSLVRALQTVDNSWDYRIPPAGDELEIDCPPYKLVGWLDDPEHTSGIDEGDMLRYGVREIECIPSKKTATALNLTFTYDGQARWVNTNDGNIIFTYEAWGDNSDDDSGDRYRYDRTVRSSGWRLKVDRQALYVNGK